MNFKILYNIQNYGGIMSDNEYKAYIAYLTPEQWKLLGERAAAMGIKSRQPLLRWAVDAFLLAPTSTYRTIQTIEPQTNDEQVAA